MPTLSPPVPYHDLHGVLVHATLRSTSLIAIILAAVVGRVGAVQTSAASQASAGVAASCLTRPGPSKTLRGLHTKPWTAYGVVDSTKFDATDAQWLSPAPKILVLVEGGSHICWHGGQIIGQLPPATPWVTMHESYGMDAHGAFFQLENVRIFDTGDGVTMDLQGDVDWHWRDVYVKYMRDDCVENDFLNSGTIENSLFDGCYSGFSARSYTGVKDGSANVVTVRHSLFRMQAMDQGYRRSGHGGFWKWGPNSPRIDLYDTIFLIDGPTIENDVIMPPAAKLRHCVGNVMIWLGGGPFPEPLPARPGCFTLLTGAPGLQYWNRAVAQWKADHPRLTKDVAPPIVSLWSPAAPTILRGVVHLTATAVDDEDVVGVQFRLNGRTLGDVTRESPVTKFTLAWDSRDAANGVYTLTAIARDAAGNTTESAGIQVTIRN